MIAIYDMPIGHVYVDSGDPFKRKYIFEDEYLADAKSLAAALNDNYDTNDYEVRRVEINDVGGVELKEGKT